MDNERNQDFYGTNAPQQQVQNSFCMSCGAQLSPNAAYCMNCGKPILGSPGTAQMPNAHQQYENGGYQSFDPQQPYQNGNYYQQPYAPFPTAQYPTPPMGQPVSKKEFLSNYLPAFKKELRSAAIFCYVCAGLNAIISLFFNPLGLIDSLILLGLSLGMHLGKNKVCAILVLVLGCLEVIFSIIAGSFGGWLWLIAGITSFVVFNKADKEYKNYIAANNYNGFQ